MSMDFKSVCDRIGMPYCYAQYLKKFLKKRKKEKWIVDNNLTFFAYRLSEEDVEFLKNLWDIVKSCGIKPRKKAFAYALKKVKNEEPTFQTKNRRKGKKD